jgi:uncharacterized alkaline shock family protein YloU
MDEVQQDSAPWIQGRVTIAPGVLTTIVRLTALEQRGVSRLAQAAPRVRGLLTGGAVDEGVFVQVSDQGVYVELHVIAKSGVNLLKLGETLQAVITRAVEEMVGMTVRAVDVHIEDVALSDRAE